MSGPIAPEPPDAAVIVIEGDALNSNGQREIRVHYNFTNAKYFRRFITIARGSDKEKCWLDLSNINYNSKNEYPYSWLFWS